MNKKNQEIKQKGGKNKLILNKKYHKLNENSKTIFNPKMKKIRTSYPCKSPPI